MGELLASRRSVVADGAVLAVSEHYRARREVGEGAELMGDEQDGVARVAQCAQCLGEALLALAVDPCGRLVEYESVGARCQCPGDEDASLLSTGERVETGVAPVPQTHGLERPSLRFLIRLAGKAETACRPPPR